MRRMIIAISLVVLSGVLFLSAPVLAGSDIKSAPAKAELTAQSSIAPATAQQTTTSFANIFKAIKLRFVNWLGISPTLDDHKIRPSHDGPMKSNTDLGKPKPELDIQRDNGGEGLVR